MSIELTCEGYGSKAVLGDAAGMAVGTTAGTVAAGDDARMSDARTPTAHTHNASDITAGQFPMARLASGTPDGTKFIRDDGTLVTPSGSATVREELVGMWTEPRTWVNIGTAFQDVYTETNSAGRPVKVDFTGKTQRAASIQWDKIGAGTQNVRAVDADNAANVLFDAVLVSGDNDVSLGALPGWATGVKRIKLQAKSTTGADDPVFRGCSIRLK